ncbi:2-keto-4-pentenoate hydratase [Marivita hallyeonensis]|uniref:2-keto-4-pentenoate hydratase n=1 Tax=Marivita hallyeonensis TaxID=996342 RepID=A0A1M5XNC9_9RHOB|nr:fumarylacetoacetate hydrolase family protein [Marivita hallyeonensis]SHI01054.1 2-keto-4-pentenoate hydratase [Marivita hallyeonensis]
MLSTKEQVIRAADALHEARITNQPTTPVRDLLAPGDVEGAYAVQRHNIDRRLTEGARMVGRKIGITTKAVQAQLGIDECDYGAIFADDFFREDEVIPANRVIQPMVEGEIAFVLGRDLTVGHPTLADVIGAIDYCLPAIEVVDSRVRDWDIQIVDTVADNASCVFVVLGGKPVRLSDVDLELCGMKMEIDGEIASTGIGAACLGSPLNATAWLAKKMVEVDLPLKAGDIVLSGALGPFQRVNPGSHVELRIAGLGKVQTRFAAVSEGTI